MSAPKWSRAIFVVLILVMASCAPMQGVKQDAPETTVSEGELPRVVAILPFQNDTQEVGIANQVRRSFTNHFSSKNYRDIKLPIVDEKIVQLEKSAGKNILELKPEEICPALGCDGLVYGKVTDYTKVYAGVYSQLGVEAEIRMINTKTGKEVFRLKDAVRYHEGGVPLSPIGVIMTAISTAMNIREIQQVRMVNELAYKFNEKIPSPSGAAEDRPVIKEALTNVKEGPFGKGKVVRVGLEGDSGLVATFDMGNFKKGIPMKETKPGIYMGEYLVLPGDNTADMPVIASLKRPGGYESEWIDVSGFVTIDTTPPPQVKGVRARGFNDRIEISWDGLKNIPDLKAYKILRSEQPLSGYAEVSMTEHPLFEDKTAQAGVTYYYRLLAVDRTGNESEPQDAVTAFLISKEPVVLTGELKRDAILSGMYVVKSEFAVPKGLIISIEPETRIMFEENASLVIRGKLNVNGRGGLPVEFIPSGEKKWKGIIVEGGNVSMDGFSIKNSGTALLVKNSDGNVENGVITDNDTGISISGTPSVIMRNCTISGNKTGVEMQKTDAKLMKNNVFQNKNGIVAKNFSGEISDNNIFDNESNITSEAAIKIGANYLGSVNVDEMKISNVTVTKTYDNRAPGGKIIDAISNPYASLSPEDRQRKATEAVIEAGNYFRQRNYGRASTLFEEALKAQPSAEIYYYLSLCFHEMREEDKVMRFLKEGVEKFPKDSTLQKALGMLHYEKGNEADAKKAFEEVIRLSPEDKQVKFMLERIGK